ncbi:MAG TPA: choice-of-anchor X domain-containing protein [Thermoanaerobaculia bacterium]|nr:choice-of-anchor X domain-containing protein [Thermoanaerobaculia bacterium]
MSMKKTIGIAMAALAVPALGLAQVEAGKLARETAKEYREMARYPESSRALKKGEADPVREKRQPTRQSRRGTDVNDPTLSVWASKVSYEKGQPVDLYASLENRGKAVAAADALTGEIVDAYGRVLAQAVYLDDGKGADLRAGDGVYSARLDPAALAATAAYMVRVSTRLADGDPLEAAGGFLLSDPAARLTGRYRDVVREGNLVIAAEVEVAERGRFHLAGTLYSKAGEPVGYAQAAANLEPGRQWIELSYYGLMFHDRQVAGPYRLGSLAFSTTTQMPNALNDLVENAYVTRPYRLRQMREVAFERPQLLETAKRLEIDAERAEREAWERERQ